MEKSEDVIEIQTWDHRMIGAYGSTELWETGLELPYP